MSIASTTRSLSRDEYLNRTYIPELDGLRAFSILIVISVHMKDRMWEWLAGRQGVTVFFVLSGYLITLLALREERAHGRLNLPAFFVRRVFRLFPLYYLVLGLYVLLIFGLGFSPEKRANLAAALPYYLTYLQEWPFFLGVNGNFSDIPFYQTWSLGIEEKFYLVWPFLAWVAWRGLNGFRLGATAGLMLLMALAPQWCGPRVGLFLYPYSHILAGCLVALLLDDAAWFRGLAILGQPWLAWATAGLLLGLHFSMPHLPAGLNQLARDGYTIATSLFLCSVVLGNGPIHWLLRRPILILIGKLSYGMYLVHLLALNVAEKLIPSGTRSLPVASAALVLTWILSAGFAYVLAITIERPGIAIGRRVSATLIRREDRGPSAPELLGTS